MKIFVTGASGYIGKVVVEDAVRAGHVVEGLARNQEAAAKVSQLAPAVSDQSLKRSRLPITNRRKPASDPFRVADHPPGNHCQEARVSIFSTI